MKKIVLSLAALFAAAFFLWAESPSLDGRALVADEGIFPRGLFAKTVGYLPGDSISVTNPANGERVDILVIGSLDPSEGVAVLLSPEAAEALNIKKNANNLVKLTKRNGGADEICNGSAVLTNGEPAPVQEDEKTISQVVEEAINSGVPVEEAVAEAVEEAEEKVADKAFDQADEKIAQEDAAELAAEGTEEGAEGAAGLALAEAGEGEEGDKEESAAESAEEGGYPQYEEPVVDELAASGEEEAADDFVEANVIDEPLPVSASEELSVTEEAVEEPVDEYEAIVLVPSESKSPEALEKVEEQVGIEALPSNEEAEFLPLQKNSGVAYLSSPDELDAQKYYVQIASCSKSETVDQIASQYGGRYPLAVIQQSGRTPVLVGPLTVDEYGVVLERFKAYGFKDAFVKVGKGSASSAYSSAYINER